MVRTWKIAENNSEELQFADQSSMDAITRQLPDGYYSTFRTYNACSRVIGLSVHLHRLPDLDVPSLRRQLIQLLEPYRPDEARVRVMMTFKGQVYLSIEPLKKLPPEIYENGVRVETTTIQRDSPRVKSTVFIGQSDEERKRIAQMGVFEALLVKKGRILEGMTSNFFYVLHPERSEVQSKDEEEKALRLQDTLSAQRVIYTARQDILLGVTRRTVIRLARGRGLDLKYKPLKTNQLPSVSEAFITSSSRGIVPVVQIDDIKVGEGRPGNVTHTLISAYEEYVSRHAEKIVQGM
jgi:branched-chain amino acid aminotransferase